MNNKMSNKKPYKKTEIKSTLPPDYLVGGYFRDNKKEELKPEYIIKYSKEISNILSHEGRDENKSSQLRKYYNFIARIRDMGKYKGIKFEKVETEIKRLSYFVEYAAQRKKVSKYFVDFINKNIEAIESIEDFKAFAVHFEAVIAYLPKDK